MAITVPAEAVIAIDSELDIVSARKQGRALAVEVGFPEVDVALIATAISEVARNIVSYANHGQIVLSPLDEKARRGLLIVASDMGPGIADLSLAMADGYSTGNSLGLGLPGSKRIMDEFDISSQVGKGTTVFMKKWVQ